MLRPKGIGSRLLAAFIAVAVLGLAASVVGWFTLRDVAQSQAAVAKQALPAVSKAEAIARVSAQMVAATPMLTNAETEHERATRAQSLFSRSAELQQNLEGLRESPLSADTIDSLERTADVLLANLHQQNELVGERLDLERSVQSRSAHTIQAANEITSLSEGLVANARARATAVIANLYDLIETAGADVEAFEALDRLTEVDMYLTERMIALRTRSAKVSGLIDDLSGAGSLGAVDDIDDGVQKHLRVMERRIESVRDPVRRARASELMAELRQVNVSGEHASLFDVQRQAVEARTEIDRLSAENLQLAQTLNRHAQSLVSEARAFAERIAGGATQASTYGLWGIVAAASVALLLTGLIVWFYVERNIARRLDRIGWAMRQLASGNLGDEVSSDGRDEIADMASAFNVLRQDAIKRRKLEEERAGVEQELRAHREELQRQVTERTTQLRAANESLRREVEQHQQARADAERADRAKSELLATISHEIKTPMSGLLGMVRVLRDTNEPAGSNDQRQRLSVVQSSAETLLSILNGILDYSKSESGRMELNESPFDLRQLVVDLETLMRLPAQDKQIDLRVEVGDDVPRWVEGDATKLRQVLFNLLSNATKFTDVGEVLLKVDSSSLGDGRTSIRFEVIDSGVGLGPRETESIFEPFYQVGGSAHADRGGTGLGLAIAQRLARALGGEISVDSYPDEGSSFHFSVPFRVVGAETSSGRHSEPEPERVAPKHVLVVEDDDVHGFVITTFLEQLGHSVEYASDGEQAVELARRRAPDAVFMDINLPGMDGLGAARLLRGATRESLPIIAVSAHVFDEEIEGYRRAGMDAVIIKPVWPESLDAALRGAMRAQDWGGVIGSDAGTGESPQGPEVLDRDQLLADEQALGWAAVERMLTLFEQSANEQLGQIREAARVGDCDALERGAHQLKSAAQSAGLIALAERCEAAEVVARQGRDDRLPAAAAAIESACEQAKAELANYRAERSAAQP